ncbi:MAG: hypothetical protein ACLSB9_28990 [Hydrogeniiclostridium mannosilyticum]
MTMKCREASRQEIIRRYCQKRCAPAGRDSEEAVMKRLLMNQAHITPDIRRTVAYHGQAASAECLPPRSSRTGGLSREDHLAFGVCGSAAQRSGYGNIPMSRPYSPTVIEPIRN